MSPLMTVSTTRRILEYTKPKNVGLMFFSREPDRFFPYAAIEESFYNALERNESPEPIFETDPERLSFCTTIFVHPQFLSSNGTKDGTKSETKKYYKNYILALACRGSQV